MPEPVVWMILGAAAILVIVFLAVRAAARRRTEGWARAVATLGFTSVPDPAPLLAELGGLATFRRGHSQRLRHVATGGTWGGTATLADFRYVTGGGKHRAIHDQTVCVLRLPALTLPHFVLRREVPVLDAIGALFGGQDIDFPEDPAFSRTFVLRGEDEPAVRALFDGVVRERLLSHAGSRFHLEGREDIVVLHRGRPIPPDAARELLEEAAAIAALLRERAATL